MFKLIIHSYIEGCGYNFAWVAKEGDQPFWVVKRPLNKAELLRWIDKYYTPDMNVELTGDVTDAQEAYREFLHTPKNVKES